ncbi:TetR/AcrR family transcriptional regulator [Pararobbsia alpina]|uniref:TetR/AcrR family transcriptional regulator n=1 Tax=Pararobbsia alpina TaxID=621374 RepID=UPI0039A6B02A
MTLRASGARPSGDTKGRILDAAEDLFIEHGFEAMSLRQITAHAEVNLAAVNYHFGSKEALIHSMLARRLDRLNQERLKLLDRFEKRFADAGDGAGLTCEHVLGALFIPALRLSRDPQHGGRAFLRLLGRAYTDPSSFVREFLAQHYASVSDRIFAAFGHALPHLPREELGWRLNFSIGALSGVLAGSDTDKLIAQFAHGEPLSDLQLIARLASLMVAALKAPVPDEASFATFAAVLGDADAVEAQAAAEEEAERAARQKSNEIERDPQTLNSSGTGNVNPTSETEDSKSRGSGGTSRQSGNGSGERSGSSVVGDPSQKIHASTGGSRTPISWPGSTTAGSFRYRVF